MVKGNQHESLLEENAKLSVALNYFFLRDPDKPTKWEYSRDIAEELAREALKPTDALAELKGVTIEDTPTMS